MSTAGTKGESTYDAVSVLDQSIPRSLAVGCVDLAACDSTDMLCRERHRRLIALIQQGNIVVRCNTPGMARAWIDVAGEVVIKLKR